MAYVTVKGTIDKFHNSGYGFSLLETYKTRDGVEASKKWQVFPEDIAHGHVPGDVVTVNGTVSAKVYSFTNDAGEQVHVATMTVNNAKFHALADRSSASDPVTDLAVAAAAIMDLGATEKTEEAPF